MGSKRKVRRHVCWLSKLLCSVESGPCRCEHRRVKGCLTVRSEDGRICLSTLAKPRGRQNAGSHASLMTFHGVPRTSIVAKITLSEFQKQEEWSSWCDICVTIMRLGGMTCWDMVVPLEGSQINGAGHAISAGFHPW